MKSGKLKQLLLITDGCSNVGVDPVSVASMAPQYGVTINVIGILDEGDLGEKGIEEVRNIALAGNGVHQVVHSSQLPRTVQMVTRKAMNQTIQQVVNKELRHIFSAEQQVEDLPPEQRGKVVEVVEELGETVALNVLILVDTSASMTNKLPAVKRALHDLSLSLQSRVGENRFALWVFPGQRADTERKIDWSTEFSMLDQHFAKLKTGGTTPTGPALSGALQAFGADVQIERPGEEGMLSDYVY
jgi:Ca-activated chloride channel family protein